MCVSLLGRIEKTSSMSPGHEVTVVMGRVVSNRRMLGGLFFLDGTRIGTSEVFVLVKAQSLLNTKKNWAVASGHFFSENFHQVHSWKDAPITDSTINPFHYNFRKEFSTTHLRCISNYIQINAETWVSEAEKLLLYSHLVLSVLLSSRPAVLLFIKENTVRHPQKLQYELHTP